MVRTTTDGLCLRSSSSGRECARRQLSRSHIIRHPSLLAVPPLERTLLELRPALRSRSAATFPKPFQLLPSNALSTTLQGREDLRIVF